MVTEARDVKAELLAEYSTVIDASTVLAILSDYDDLSNEAQVEGARQILDIIRESIPEEERTGFDPSATAGNGQPDELGENVNKEDESTSAKSFPGWTSQTDNTSISQDVRSLELEGLDLNGTGGSTSRDESPEVTYTSALDGLEATEKENTLIGMFPALKPFDIKWTLKKCKWDAALAIDELMTQSFLEESGSRHRGIEAFSESDVVSKPRKSKGKKRRTHLTEDTSGSLTDASKSQSKWHSATQDIEFIADKTGMPTTQVSSLYHNNGALVHSTLRAIIDAHKDLNLNSDDPINLVNAYELQETYPRISLSDLEVLLQITHPSTEAARDLAKALTSPPTTSKPGGILIEVRHKAPEDENEPVKVKSKPYYPTQANEALDYASASSQANNFFQARDMARTQASSAYRKGKSDPLMGAAAGYYSQISRDLGDRARNMSSAAADALVAQQSSKSELDLHGVNVKDALRITSERVNTWWHELGESRINGRGGIGPGYRIVTGLGKHSEGGKGKLGPAVGKMLMREGWKVEVGSGVLVVTGVARKT